RVFNCGLGMVAIVAPADVEAIAALLVGQREQVHRVGRVIERREGMPGAIVNGMARAWPG
ncbi:MAG: AIR synthase-related protein, partial [Dongiaceae bacterium]